MKNYILKTVNSDMTSYNGFKWKKRGIVKCEDWKPTKECGNGLHGALNGCGNGELFNWDKNAIWIVAEVDKSKGVDLDGKWKFPECKVVFTGNQKEATDYLLKKVGDVPMIGCFKVGGHRSTVSGGYKSTVSGGDWSTVSGGDESTVSGGDESTVSGGYYSNVSGGYKSNVSGGY